MIRKTAALASLAILAAAAAMPFAARADDGNVVGGGAATIIGGGDNAVITYSMGGAGGGGGPVVQGGRSARFAGSTGDGAEVLYLEAVPAGAGREAWLVGGGDDTQVIYSSPTRR